jgi:hypothetical protein
MPNANDFLPGQYLNAAAIPVGARIRAKITKVEPHKFDDGKSKLVIFTNSTKGIVLNKGRGQVLIGAFGHDYAKWPGAEIIIFRGETRFGGQRVASVEIEASNGSGDGAPMHDRVPDGPDEDGDTPL